MNNPEEMRTEIISLIISGAFSSNDMIHKLCMNKGVQNLFINDERFKKKPESDWTANYAAELSMRGVTRHFNEDYLLHLNDVVQFCVRKIREQNISELQCTMITGLSTYVRLKNSLKKLYVTIKIRHGYLKKMFKIKIEQYKENIGLIRRCGGCRRD